MATAFNNFKEINSLDSNEKKQEEWLIDYHGLHYSIAVNKVHTIKWATEKRKYNLREFAPHINCIARKKDRLVIEFDEVEGEPNNPKESLEKVIVFLKENNWGYIRSTHSSLNSDYIWVEFARDLTSLEAKRFLQWICPEGSRIDLNFASDKKVFPVLFARHWKYSQVFEVPLDYALGEKIDFDSLNIPKKQTEITNVTEEGFFYKTFIAGKSFTSKNQAESFSDVQPIFYDNAKIFWLWNSEDYKWEKVDEVDILNVVEAATGQDVISPKNRAIILNSLKQQGRKMIPKKIKPTWIQFKDTIYDVETSETIKSSSEYFVTNPIPQSLNFESSETPCIDKLFSEWVGEESKEILYEIIAYCMLPSMPLHRIFCFIGGGMNGKSCYLELLRRFIGGYNCCSTELDTLMNSRFEVSRLHKKLVCQMGETNFGEMKRTSMIKKLSGGDLIGFEYKGKDPFEDINYAKLIIATNSLPSTGDKTIGFYRRWLIIDFPNQFDEKKDVLATIPPEEYECLATKCVVYLKTLLQKREFTNEGTLEERVNRYEAKSNYLSKFITESTVESFDFNYGYITKNDFNKKFKEWCKENRHRELSETSVGIAMKKEGIESSRKQFNWMNDGKGGQARVWVGLKWKE